MKDSNTADAAGSVPTRSAAVSSSVASVTVNDAPFAPLPDSAAAPAAPSALDEKVELWFAKHFHNLGALLDERMHNVIQAAKEDLKAELAKL